MSTELLTTPQSILSPRSAAGAGAGQGGARVAGLSGQAPSGMSSAVDSSIETGRIGGGIAATEVLTLGKEGLKEVSVTPLLPPVRPTRPSRSSSRSGNVVPSTLLPRNSRKMNHFPISDTSDSAYSEWLVKHSLPRACLSILIYGETNKLFRARVKNAHEKTSKIKEIALSWNQRQANCNVNWTKTYNWISSKFTPVDASHSCASFVYGGIVM